MGGKLSLVAGAQWYREGCRDYGKRGFARAQKAWRAAAAKDGAAADTDPAGDGIIDPAERDMTGKVAIVTGANSGIGKACALGFARRRMAVHMVCRNQERGAAARSRAASVAR